MRRASMVAFGLALLAAVAGVLLPVQHTVVSQAGPGPLHTMELTTANLSLLETEGFRILLVAAIPVALALVPLVFGGGRYTRMAAVSAAALLGAFVIAAGFSIGLFYLPATLASIFAARHPLLVTSA